MPVGSTVTQLTHYDWDIRDIETGTSGTFGAVFIPGDIRSPTMRPAPARGARF
jgi:hypothetical protein